MNYIIRAGAFLNILFLILSLVEIGNAFVNMTTAKLAELNIDQVELKPITVSERPDLYLIVMDEYSGFNALKQYYNFDNNEFSNQLKARGFFVAKNPNSNYDGTFFSMLSLLGMGYLHSPVNNEKLIVNAYSKTVSLVENNTLTDFFFRNGYTIVNNSFFKIKNSSSKPIFFLPFEEDLATNKTFGNFLLNEMLVSVPSNKLQFLLNTYYAKVDNYNQEVILQTIKTSKKIEAPKFVYAHLLMPHQPYLREKNGELKSFAETLHDFKNKKYNYSYVNYLEYCNSVVLNIVDNIQKQNRNSIIALISDHGNRWLAGDKKKQELDFNNFLSVYSPKGIYTGLSDTTCSVNLFRILLNSHFNQELPLLINQKNSVFGAKSPNTN